MTSVYQTYAVEFTFFICHAIHFLHLSLDCPFILSVSLKTDLPMWYYEGSFKRFLIRKFLWLVCCLVLWDFSFCVMWLGIDYKFRKDEIFKRMKPTTFAQMVSFSCCLFDVLFGIFGDFFLSILIIVCIFKMHYS